MPRVVLSGNLRQLAGGAEQIDVEAVDIRQLLRVLGERFPKMRPQLDQGIAVAIDGEIYQDGWLEPIGPDSEVHLLPRIGGGAGRVADIASRAASV